MRKRGRNPRRSSAGRIFVLATSALAAGLPTPLSAAARLMPAIAYQAPADCPSAGEFAALVASRADAAADSRRPTDDTRFLVQIVDVSSGKQGFVRRIQGAVTSEPRVVFDDDCGRIAAALALTVALSSVAAVEQQPPPVVVIEPFQDGAARASVPPVVAARAIWAVGGGAMVNGLLPPQPLAGLALFVENRAGLGAAADQQVVFRPDVRLTLSAGRNDVLRSPQGAAFSLVIGALDLCPMGRRFPGAVDVRLCADGAVGLVESRGLDITSPQSATSYWAAMGALGRLRARLGGRSFVEAQGGALGTIWLSHYVYEMPRTPVATPARLVWTAALSLGLTIP
jgi:hypothetical protein